MCILYFCFLSLHKEQCELSKE